MSAPVPPLPAHLEGVAEIHGYHPAHTFETACGLAVVPFGPVSHHREHVTCRACAIAEHAHRLAAPGPARAMSLDLILSLAGSRVVGKPLSSPNCTRCGRPHRVDKLGHYECPACLATGWP